jgi:hypothetical protein
MLRRSRFLGAAHILQSLSNKGFAGSALHCERWRFRIAI